MPAFQYIASSASGKEQQGVLEGESARDVRKKLRDQGLIPISVLAVSDKNRTTEKGVGLFSWRFKKGIQHHERVLLTRQLATLLSSGMPVAEALLGVAQQSERNPVKTTIMAIRSRVIEGHSLATGFRDFPSVFSELYCETVRAGESSGRLEQVLEELAEYTEKQQILRQKISSAAVYPCIMIIVSLAIVAFLLSFVVPQLVDLFQDSDQALPWLTTAMIAISDWVNKYYGAALCILLLCAYFTRQLLQRERFRQRAHAWFLLLPFFGKMIKTVNTARFARTFAILTSSGVPVLEAMNTAAEVVMNITIKNSIKAAALKVREGGLIHKALQDTAFFPPMSIHLIATGEASSSLAKMLIKAATAQEREIAAVINQAVTLFEPLMTLVMGAVILLIVLSVLLPIFSLSTGIA